MSQGTLFAPPAPSVAPRELAPAGAVVLRHYQVEAINGGRGFPGALPMLADKGSGLLVAATGVGKTTIAAHVVAAYVSQRRRVLFLAHRTELLEQAKTRFVRDTAIPHRFVEIEQGGSRATWRAPVVVASVASMRGRRLRRWPRDHFGLIVTDEAHHSRAASYEAIYEWFGTAHRLGITATPDRADQKGLGKWHAGICFAFEIRDAIAEQFLVPVRAKLIFVDAIDLTRVKSHHGDLDERQLEEVMMRAEALHGIAKPTVELTGERPTIVFANGVGHARALADSINVYAPGQARAIDGSASAELRRATIRDFTEGRFRYLSNCQLYTEGVDLPLASCAVMARPTESRGLFAQCAGRVLRLFGDTWADSVANGKTDALILDFCGNAGRHRLACALDLLDGSVDEKVRRRAVKRAQEEEIDVSEALAEAEREEVVQQRLELVAQVRYRVVEVEDQFSLLGVRPRAGRWGGAAATEAQLAVLQKAKIRGAEKLDRGQASQVIDALVERRRQGLCTIAMASRLLRAGINPDLPFERAHRVIDAIAANGWRGVPASLLESEPDLVLSAETMLAKRKALGI